MDLLNDVIQIIKDTLNLSDSSVELTADSELLGGIPEFDSIAVVSLVTALEDEFGCTFDDDELTAETFATVQSLTDLLAEKV